MNPEGGKGPGASSAILSREVERLMRVGSLDDLVPLGCHGKVRVRRLVERSLPFWARRCVVATNDSLLS